MSTYNIVRYYRDTNHPDHGRLIKTGLTLEEAQEWCNDDETHQVLPNGDVIWFDGYQEE